jgi:hypothetical protein
MVGGIWQFLKDPANLTVLGSIGAGIAALAGGAWAIFTFFAKKGEKGPSAPSVKAYHGSVAAGHDINAPVTIGLDEKGVGQEVRKAQEPLRDELERLAAQVARNKGVEVAPLLAVLAKLGEAGVPENEIPKRLDAKADELIELRDKLDKLKAENELLRRSAQGTAFDEQLVAIEMLHLAARQVLLTGDFAKVKALIQKQSLEQQRISIRMNKLHEDAKSALKRIR